MAFDVSIKITATSQLEGAKAAEEAVRRINEEVSKAGAASGSFEKPTRDIEKFSGSLRPANQALNVLTSQLGLLGPVGNAAGNLFFQISDGVTRGTVAVGAFAIGVAAVGNALQRSSQEAAEFGAAVRENNRDFFSQGVERLQGIAADRGGILSGALSLVKGLFGDTDRLVFDLTGKIADYQGQIDRIDASKVREVTEAFKLQADAIGASPLQRVDIQARQQITELNTLFTTGKISAGEYRAALAGIESVRGASVAEFNRGLREQIELLEAANNPLEQIEIKMRRLRGGADAGTLGNLGELQRLQENAAKIAAGSPLVAQGFSQIGAAAVLPKTQLDALAKSAFDLDQRFQQGLISARQYQDGLKQIAVGALPTDERRLVESLRGIKSEITDLGLSKQLSSVDLVVFEQLQGKIQGIKDAAREIFGFEIPPSVTAQIQGLEGLINQIAQEKKIDINVTGNYEAELARIQARIDALNNQTINLTVNTQATGSPTLGFSEYFENYAPSVLQKFASSAPSIRFDSGLAGVINGLNTSIATNVAFLHGGTRGPDPGGALSVFAGAQVRAASESLDLIKESLGIPTGLGGRMANVRPAAVNTEGGSAGGGGSNVTVNFYFPRGTGMDRRSLDEEVMPALERTIIRATGQSPKFNVLN